MTKYYNPIHRCFMMVNDDDFHDYCWATGIGFVPALRYVVVEKDQYGFVRSIDSFDDLDELGEYYDFTEHCGDNSEAYTVYMRDDDKKDEYSVLYW